MTFLQIWAGKNNWKEQSENEMSLWWKMFKLTEYDCSRPLLLFWELVYDWFIKLLSNVLLLCLIFWCCFCQSKNIFFVVCLARYSVLPVVVWKAGWCTWTGKKPGFVLPATVHLWMVSDMKLIRIVIHFPLYTGSFCTSEFPGLNHFTGVMSFLYIT